jgi:DNA modification methylase
MEPTNPAQWVHIDDVKPWENNPRNNDHAVEHVAKSIERFGWGAPIIARRSDGVIIAGHTRHKAAKSLGMDKVLVRYMDLDPAQSAALALADNKLGEIADWDDAGVAEILKDLDAQSFDLSGLGWDDAELDAILASDVFNSIDTEPAPDTDDNAIPEEIPTITQPGDSVKIGRHDLHCVDCLLMLRNLPTDSVDSIVTDPPYGIGFMGKGWDSSVPGAELAAECLRVLKPGGYMVAFAATRTVHRLAVNLEDAGFEIRDQIAWLQWQGFPKSLDISKAIDNQLGYSDQRKIIGTKFSGIAVPGEKRHTVGGSRAIEVNITAPASPEAIRHDGWGTGLKPAQEPAILARKPLDGTVADNVLKHGTGGLNIDGCRIPYGDPAWPQSDSHTDLQDAGRWPSNVYYCVKPARSEKEAGCEELKSISGANAVSRKEGSAGLNNPRAGASRTADEVKNFHPTVKPIKLMRWLIRLVTPPGGLVVEPFGGSGTTLIAAEREGFSCIASELEPQYCDIIRARLSAALESE